MPKKTLADYGKDESEEDSSKPEPAEEGEEDSLAKLAESTGVSDPMALMKLIKRVVESCM